jgi:hypothetical protein
MRLTILLAVLLAPSAARAHRMDVTAAIPSSAPATVRVEAGYEGDDPAQEATVRLLDGAGRVVADGTTDERGVCVLPRPSAGAYTVRVDDGQGHRAEVVLTVPSSETELAEARTGQRNRWAMTAAGLAVIAGGTVLARWLFRKPG